jgi:DNA adenine methylase
LWFCFSYSKKETCTIEVINDIDDEIVNLFEQLRTNQKELCEQISLTPYAEKELERARSINGVTNISKMERARLF